MKCEKIPIVVVIIGPGCVKIGMQGVKEPLKLCGEGEHSVEGFGAGIIQLEAIPDKDFSINRVRDLPKTDQTKYRKPNYQFYFNNQSKSPIITFEFGEPINVNKPPAGNILGINP